MQRRLVVDGCTSRTCAFSTACPTGCSPATWRGDFDFAVKRCPGGIYNLCLHPQSIGRGHRWLMFERVIEHFKESGNVVFETLGSYANRWRSDNDFQTWCEP
jgi:hypothetical protein